MHKISIFDVNPFCKEPVHKIYKLIKQAGFDSVILGWRDDNRLEKLDAARNAGLLIENIHAPFKNGNSIWHDNLKGDDYEKCLLASIDNCKKYNIPTMVVHLCNSIDVLQPNSTGIERLKRLAEQAEDKNINVAFENGYTPDDIHFVFENISSNNFGFCFDSCHQSYMTPDRNLLEEFGGRLMALHLSDGFGIRESKYEKGSKEYIRELDVHLLPFDGNMDWNKITRQLNAIQYKAAIALEVNPFTSKYPYEEFYNEAFGRAIKLWDMVNN